MKKCFKDIAIFMVAIIPAFIAIYACRKELGLSPYEEALAITTVVYAAIACIAAVLSLR